MKCPRGGALLLLALITLALATPGSAQKPPAPAAQPAAPPFAVQGFRYQQLQQPGSNVTTHMNDCEEAACGPGSKVSYIFFGPQPHSFDAYKTERSKVEAFMRSQIPAGIKITFDPPTVQKVGPVTIYEARRTQTAPDGSTHVAISTSFNSDSMQIDLISSSAIPKAAEGNTRTFQSMIVIWMAIQADKNKK
ncbi:MAG: hypothetical protein ACKVP7_02700 [Hyphomicrobiaceae bacterium]